MTTTGQLSSRASLSTLLIFEGFSVALTCLFLYAAVARHSGWEGVTVGIAICIAVFIWWRAFSIEIDASELRYKSLFTSPKAIELRYITKTVRRIEVVSKSNHPPNRIEIYGTVDGKQVKFDINMKPFSSADIRKIERLLRVI